MEKKALNSYLSYVVADKLLTEICYLRAIRNQRYFPIEVKICWKIEYPFLSISCHVKSKLFFWSSNNKLSPHVSFQ